MNCKPGDLAVNVGRRSEFVGEVYLVLRLYDGPWIFTTPEEPSWWIEHRGREFHCADADLRPIRPQDDDATDETLLWLPVPTKETA